MTQNVIKFPGKRDPSPLREALRQTFEYDDHMDYEPLYFCLKACTKELRYLQKEWQRTNDVKTYSMMIHLEMLVDEMLEGEWK